MVRNFEIGGLDAEVVRACKEWLPPNPAPTRWISFITEEVVEVSNTPRLVLPFHPVWHRIRAAALASSVLERWKIELKKEQVQVGPVQSAWKLAAPHLKSTVNTASTHGW